MKFDSKLTIATATLAILIATALYAQDKYSLKSPSGIAFSDFKGYEDWWVVSSARTTEVLKVIVANPTEARAFLDTLPDSKGSSPPSERVRTNYDENTFRQLYLGIQAAAEERLAKTDPATHAVFHIGRGQELLAQGFVAEAQKQFEEAVALDASSAEAHAGLARALEAANDITAGRAEAEKALAVRIFVDPLLLLARLDLRDNKTDAAALSIDRALKLDPANSSARTLKRAVTAKLAEKALPVAN